MRRKFLATAMALVAVAGAAILSLASPAAAQTGSGVGPCTAVAGIQNVGNVTVGQRFVLQLAPTCVFGPPGVALTVTVNGVNIPGKVANASGFVTVDITVVSATQLSIEDPTLTPAICGTNTVIATGPSPTAQGGISTQTATFTITCGATPVGATPVGATPATAVTGRLSLTGANSLRYIAVALVLVALGSMVLVATRRRRANTI